MHDTLTIAKRNATRRKLDNFKRQYGANHYEFARYAAVPIDLTPETLYRVWSNFPTGAPWHAVADLLLSRLCTEVSYELYEMDTGVRELLLADLPPSTRQAVANFSLNQTGSA